MIACLAFEGRNQQNMILENQEESQVDGDLIMGAGMCILALVLLLPSLIVDSYGKHEQEENAPEVEDEAPLSDKKLVQSADRQLLNANEAL